MAGQQPGVRRSCLEDSRAPLRAAPLHAHACKLLPAGPRCDAPLCTHQPAALRLRVVYRRRTHLRCAVLQYVDELIEALGASPSDLVPVPSWHFEEQGVTYADGKMTLQQALAKCYDIRWGRKAPGRGRPGTGCCCIPSPHARVPLPRQGAQA